MTVGPKVPAGESSAYQNPGETMWFLRGFLTFIKVGVRMLLDFDIFRNCLRFPETEGIVTETWMRSLSEWISGIPEAVLRVDIF